jgi:hypothetical protein
MTENNYVRSSQNRIKSTILYDEYKNWAIHNQLSPIGRYDLSKLLRSLGYQENNSRYIEFWIDKLKDGEINNDIIHVTPSCVIQEPFLFNFDNPIQTSTPKSLNNNTLLINDQTNSFESSLDHISSEIINAKLDKLNDNIDRLKDDLNLRWKQDNTDNTDKTDKKVSETIITANELNDKLNAFKNEMMTTMMDELIEKAMPIIITKINEIQQKNY